MNKTTYYDVAFWASIVIGSCGNSRFISWFFIGLAIAIFIIKLLSIKDF